MLWRTKGVHIFVKGEVFMLEEADEWGSVKVLRLEGEGLDWRRELSSLASIDTVLEDIGAYEFEVVKLSCLGCRLQSFARLCCSHRPHSRPMSRFCFMISCVSSKNSHPKITPTVVMTAHTIFGNRKGNLSKRPSRGKTPG